MVGPTEGRNQPQVLVVGDFTPNLEKVHRHVGPLARVSDPTMVCLTPTSLEGVRFRTAPSAGFRPLGLCLMFLVALSEAIRGDYDAVVSFSLVPHGTFALIIARIVGCPVHVGVIGADLDVHERARYGPLIRWLLRRFDAVSVPGRTHRHRLHAMGIPHARTAILTNPIDVDRYSPRAQEPQYDVLWVGRFSEEKDPLLFVESCRALRARGIDVTAAMVGDGPQWALVRDRLIAYDLETHVDLPGWVDDPERYFQRSRLFALTSERDALPLTLIEAMATGSVPVVPDIGNVTDVARDEQNALVIEERTPAAFAAAFERLLSDDDRLTRLQSEAPSVRETHSMSAAAADWRGILERMCVPAASPPSSPNTRITDRSPQERELHDV